MRLVDRWGRSRVLVVVLALVAGAVSLQPAAGDVTTVSHDALRTGWDPSEPGLGPDSVTSSDFGQQFVTPVDGQVYAQPLVAGGTLVVATEHNKVYGLDPANGSVKWSRALGPSWPASAISCGDLAPDVGVTSTPVYDPATNAVYLTAKVNDGPDVGHPHWYMHALDPASGAERAGWPVLIAGTASNDPTVTFDPMVELQRPGLLLLDGHVYAGFGGHCDKGQYRGYVVGVSTSSATMTSMWADEVGVANRGAGIWQSGGGLVSDGPGRIFLTTGNGVMAPAGPGNKPPGTLSESVVRLQTNADQTLGAADFFSPSNAPTLDLNDTDFGSGGPAALPDSFGTPSHPDVLVQEGKDGRIFLLDRDALGGRSQGAGGSDAVLGMTGPYQGQWDHPAAWSGDGGYVYLVGNGGPLRALKSGTTGAGLPALTPAGTSADTFPYTSGSPVITSDGTTSGSGVVWVVWANGPQGGAAQLRAYSALPDGAGRLQLLYSAPIGTAPKFAVPATDGGHVYVGTRDGTVIGFGRPANSALTAAPVDFGEVAVGSSAGTTITLTATKALNVTGIAAAAPFGVTAPPLPVSMKAGDQLVVPVSFSPGSAGSSAGVLSVTTDTGRLEFSLNGIGTQPGLAATPAAATFADQPVGTSATVNVQVTNTGTSAETLGAVTGSSGPFSVTGLPATGTVVPPGGSFVVEVTYTPTAQGSSTSSITVASTSGTLTVPISGTAVTGMGKLVLTPASVDFGTVPTGSPRTLSFDITNTGNLPVTISKAKAPLGDFSSDAPLAEGTVIGAGQVIHQTVTFQPSSAGSEQSSYDLTGDAGQGAMSLLLTGTGAGPVPAPSATGWSINSAARLSGGLVLTPAARAKAGSAFYRRAVPTEGLHATFTARLGPGSGGDGLTFALLNPGQPVTSVGGTGGGVGFLGLHGVAVSLVTTKNAQARSHNFIGVTAGRTGKQGLVYVATAAVPRALRSGTHLVDVRVAGGRIVASVDGLRLLNVAVAGLPASALVGFTAGTGVAADAHTVSGVSIVSVAARGAALTATPSAMDFGEVQVGSSAMATLVLANKGSQPETVSAVGAPGGPYTAGLPSVGVTVAAGGSVSVPVTFRPAVDGTFPQSLTVTTTGGKVVVPLSGMGSSELPPLSSMWAYNGLTTLAGDSATLTKNGQRGGAGSLVSTLPVSPLGLHATFTAQIGGSGAVGADGMTFALLDASSAKPSSIGAPGGGLGLAGLPAVFASLDTYSNVGVKSHNFMAVGTSSKSKVLSFLKTTTAIPALRTGTHTVDVVVTPARHMIVKIDGRQVLDVVVKLPPKILVAFTAGIGTISDTHTVINPTVTYTGG